MRQDLAELLHERRGHFEYESKHHGDRWLELERLFLRPDKVRPLARALASRVSAHQPEIVCGPLVEGAFVGLLVAEELGLEFIYAERFAGPGGAVAYRVPAALRQVEGRRVAVVNDVVNAGSAVGGALKDLTRCGAQPVVLATLLALGDRPDQLAAERNLPLEALARASVNIWKPEECPLCSAGEEVTPHPGN